MDITRQEQKKEAIERMRILKLLPTIIGDFKENDVIYYSELMGILYWITNKPEWVEFIKEFETEYNALVYHAELSHLEFGRCLSMLYVSNKKSEWLQDKKELQAGYCIAYVKNLDDDYCSELGGILIKPSMGGLKRVA